MVGLFGAADLATVAPAAHIADFGAPPFVHGARIRTEGARGPACSYHRRWPRIAHGKTPTEDGSLTVFETAVAAAKPLPEEKKRKERAPKPEKPPPQPVRSTSALLGMGQLGMGVGLGQLKVLMRGVVRRGRKQNLCVSLLLLPHAPPPQPALQPDATSEQDQHPEEDGCRDPEFEEGGVGR